MKKFLLVITIILIAFKLSAQTFDVDTLHWSGDKDNRVNLVIVGDGYTSSEQDKFVADAQQVSDAFFQTVPYIEYKNYFNVLAVKVESNQSGASHGGVSSDNACGSQPVASVDNYFGSAFDCGNNSYHRLLCATQSWKVSSVMAANWPTYDQVLILVNSSYYGGAGGTHAVTSTHGSANEIAIHEVGHSFAYLADEYWAGSIYATNAKPNMTNHTDLATVKWYKWNGYQNVGLYSHSGDPSWYKPVNGSCKMEYLGTSYPFCPVCTEAHILKTLDLTQPYDAYSPGNGSTIDVSSDINFEITTVLPTPNTLKVSWNLNGTDVQIATDSLFTLSHSSLPTGTSTLRATILDTTALIRSDAHATGHTYIIEWTLDKSSATGVNIDVDEYALEYTVFPNPTEGQVNVQYNLEESANIIVELIDLNGVVVLTQNLGEQVAGQQAMSMNTSRVSSGAYQLRLTANGSPLIQEKIIVN